MACDNDESIGPAVHGCRGDFDFTLTFELIFLTLIPTCAFLVIGGIRIAFLWRQPHESKRHRLLYLKLGLTSCYIVLQALLVAFSVQRRDIHLQNVSPWLLASRALSLVAGLSLFVLSWLEHERTYRPSIVINAFLLTTFLFDIVQTRTVWLLTPNETNRAYACAFTAATAVKSTLLVLESIQKVTKIVWATKGRSPEESSGVYSLGIYFWLNRLFHSGFRKVLQLKDLYPLDPAIASGNLAAKFAKHVRDGKSLRGQKRGLAWLLVRTFSGPLMLPVIPRLIYLAASFCQSFLISALLEYLEKGSSARNRAHGFGLIAATALTYGTIATSTALYWYLQERFVAMVRGCLVASIYNKTTVMSISAMQDSGAITLMSTDVERVQSGILDLHEYWANCIQVALACWWLKRQLGPSFAAPIVVVILSVFASSYTGRLMGPRQRAWMQAIQRRVDVTSNAVRQMKLIKMSGMAGPVQQSIQNLRLKEISLGFRWRMLLAVAATVSQVPMVYSPVITFALTSKALDTNTMFVSLSYLTLMATPLMTLFQKLPQLLGALTCLQRIQEFLERPSRTDFRVVESGPVRQIRGQSINEHEVELQNMPARAPWAIKITQGFFGWEDGKYLIQNMNVSIPSGQTTIVTGPVASGKSTLCMAILGEVPFAKGFVSISGCRRIGYCDQQPFLASTTIRENIIGHSHYDAQRYYSVIQATMLQPDFELFPQGDKTQIGSGGIALSGGQRQRVAVARALYTVGVDLLIFDDVLSGLDSTTSDAVFRNLFGADGWVRRHGLTAVLCTHNRRCLSAADHIIELSEDTSAKETDQVPCLEEAGDRFLALQESQKSATLNVAPSVASRQTDESEARPENDAARRLGDWAVYRRYFSLAGRAPASIFIIFGALNGFLLNFPRLWLTYWSSDVDRQQAGHAAFHSKTYYNGIYGLLQVITMMSFVVAGITVLHTIIRNCGTALHQSALQTVIQAPLSFFTTTDTGVAVNYFSQDMTLIDGELPVSILNLVIDSFSVLGMAAVLGSSSPWLVLTYPFLVWSLSMLLRFYLRTSRQLRLLDLEAKSPLYSHFLDTVRGITTLRAFACTSQHIDRNHFLLNQSQRPAYLLAMIQRWLYCMLSLSVAVLATVMVALITQIPGVSSGLSGASLTTLMVLSESLSDIVKFYAKLETSIGAVARLSAFSRETKKEKGQEGSQDPGEGWPRRGQVDLCNVWASYDLADGDYALRGVDLKILSGEKVAICGRTGSGKSSLILTLLGLLPSLPRGPNNQDTVLVIDDVPVSKVDPRTLRSQLITIPQDPVFLPGNSTVAQNLDPFHLASEEQLHSVIKSLSMDEMVSQIGGLHAPLREDKLSVGQRQIFSLARAATKRRTAGCGNVLLLDEFTSSVDIQTEHNMLKVMSDEFKGCTIIMISHRLDMVVELFDRVVVMDHGSVVETGDPRLLARMEGSWFSSLIESTAGRRS